MTSTFDTLWTNGLNDARQALIGRNPAAAGLATRLRQPSFPAALALLTDRNGQGPSGRERIAATATALASERDIQSAGMNAGDVEGVLTRLFVRRELPSVSGRSERDSALVLARTLARERLPVNDAEAREIVQLLETGQFYGDFVSTAGAVFHTIPALPAALLRDLPNLPALPVSAARSIFDDVFAFFGAIPALAADLRDGRIDAPPATMTNFLAGLYGFATVDRIRDLLSRLLDRRNRSVRLALLLYARCNGFDLQEDDLDTVHDHLFATAQPDLGPVLAQALESLERRYSGAQLDGVVAALQRGTQA